MKCLHHNVWSATGQEHREATKNLPYMRLVLLQEAAGGDCCHHGIKRHSFFLIDDNAVSFPARGIMNRVTATMYKEKNVETPGASAGSARV
eukprot:m.38500 g.38500  ORF g.38500 m.38500 type:complete len:91 (+) comp14632_c0_seq4:101-373(+)